MRVYVNGESREVAGTLSLAELITQLDLPAARIAVELNRAVVRRGDWGSTMLQDEDRIEIVHFVGGGCSGGREQGQGAGAGSGSRGREQEQEAAASAPAPAPAPCPCSC